MLILSILLMLGGHASIVEFIGASSSTMGVAGQSTHDNDPSNLFYNGAIYEDSNKNQFNIGFLAVHKSLREFNNILIKSPVNSDSVTEEYGDFNEDYEDDYLFSLNGSFLLSQKYKLRLNLNVITPVDKLIEADTGDPYLPHYVMYSSQFKRLVLKFSLTKKFESGHIISIGSLNSFTTTGEAAVVAKNNGSSDGPSSGRIRFEALPTSALNIAWSYKNTYFHFQDKLISDFETRTNGYTPIGATVPYDWKLESMLVFEPQTFRIGHKFNLNKKIALLASVDYQVWDDYKAPTLNMIYSSGVLAGSESSANYETKNIFVPKLGFIHSLDKYQYSFGASYRPSPLELKDELSGNNLDMDAWIAGASIKRKFNAFDIGLGLQYQKLESVNVSKKGIREDGESGNKLGSDRYKASGEIFAVSFDLSWVL